MAAVEAAQPLTGVMTEDERVHERKKFREAYYLGGAVNTRKGYSGHQVIDYSPIRLSTLVLLCQLTGTVLRHWVLWAEQLAVVALYLLTGVVVQLWNIEHDQDAMNSLGVFVDKMSTLAAFLLSFYTNLAVSRWWRLRTDGVGAIWSAACQLSLFVSQFVTEDQQVLRAIRRYARASLAMIFMKRRYGSEWLEHLSELEREGILEKDEVDLLKNPEWNNNLAESIWTWHAQIIRKLHDDGKIKSDQLFVFLLEKVNVGRTGAALTGAQMSTPIPLPYVHLLGFLVKLHNLTLALAFGYLLGVEWDSKDRWVRLVMHGRVFFVPMLYNALLLINADLADPFDGDINDFPLEKYERGIDSDAISYIQAGHHLPTWLRKTRTSTSESS